MTSLREWWNRWRHRANRTVPSTRLILVVLILALLNFTLSGWLLTDLWFWVLLTLAFGLVVVYDLAGVLNLRVAGQRQATVRPQLQIPFAMTGQVAYAPASLTLVDVDWGMVPPFAVTGKLEQLSPEGFQDSAELHVLSRLDRGPRPRTTTLLFEQNVVALRRGRYTLAPMDCKFRSRFGFWNCLVRTSEPQEVLVVPDLTTWRPAVLALQQTLSQEGTHLKRLQLGDHEFSHVADYVPDDDPRRINWAASARRRRLMKNVYEAEQGQQVIIAVDASRYMQVGFANGKTRLDYALECAAALASTALHVGDRVGVMAFTHHLLFQLPPRRGSEHWRQMIEHLAGLEAESVQGGYETLLRHLRGSFHRRSLLVIVSELEGVESDPGFLRILAKVQRQHPTLFVSLADTEAQAQVRSTPEKTEHVPRMASANWMLEERFNARQSLQHKGVSIVESLPGDVVVDVVQAYLQRRLRLRR